MEVADLAKERRWHRHRGWNPTTGDRSGMHTQTRRISMVLWQLWPKDDQPATLGVQGPQELHESALIDLLLGTLEVSRISDHDDR